MMFWTDVFEGKPAEKTPFKIYQKLQLRNCNILTYDSQEKNSKDIHYSLVK